MHPYSKSKYALGVTPVTELAGAGRRVKVLCTWHLDPCSYTWMCTEMGFSTLALWPFGAEQYLVVFCASSEIYKTPWTSPMMTPGGITSIERHNLPVSIPSHFLTENTRLAWSPSPSALHMTTVGHCLDLQMTETKAILVILLGRPTLILSGLSVRSELFVGKLGSGPRVWGLWPLGHHVARDTGL